MFSVEFWKQGEEVTQIMSGHVVCNET